MNILITGGLGFIGSNFVKYCLNKYKDFEIYVIDSLTYAANRSLLTKFRHFSKFHFIKGDISDNKFLTKAFSKHKFDYVINFAAETSVDKSFINPELFYQSNVIGTINLMVLSKKFNVKRFHQVSTDEVYGDLEIDSTYKFKETDRFNAKNFYSLSKASAEEALITYGKIYDLDYTISRSVNNFGPYQGNDKLIPLVINRILQGREVPVFGDGKNIRTWIYVLDHCKAIDLILFNGKKGETYNVSSNFEMRNIDLIKEIIKRLKGDKSLIKFVEDRKIHDKKYTVDTSKIEELGFKCDYDFSFGLDETLEFYRSINE